MADTGKGSQQRKLDNDTNNNNVLSKPQLSLHFYVIASMQSRFRTGEVEQMEAKKRAAIILTVNNTVSVPDLIFFHSLDLSNSKL